MSRHIWRQALPHHFSKRLTTLLAALAVLGAVCISSAETPAASAQCFTCFGNGLGINNGFGFNNGLGFTNGFGLNPALGFNNGVGLNNGIAFNNGLYGAALATLAYNNLGLNSYLPNYAITSTAPGYVVPRSYSQVSGQYCTDKSGGQIWVPTGVSITGLICNGSSSSSPATSPSSVPTSSPSYP